jgi:hypothetical protein
MAPYTNKLDTATGEWSDITPLRQNIGGEAGFGYTGLATDPRKPGTVMVSTMSRWGPVDDVFRSVDGGTTWQSWGPPLISALGDIGGFRPDRLDVVPPDGQASNPVSGTSPSLD